MLGINQGEATALSEKEQSLLLQSIGDTFPLLNTPEIHYEIGLTLVSVQEMTELNQTQRGKNEPTDVLSFPLYPSLSAITEDKGPSVLLGDIVICPEIAEAQGTSLLELLHHGALHLLGFDHESDMEHWQHAERAIIDRASCRNLSIRGLSAFNDEI